MKNIYLLIVISLIFICIFNYYLYHLIKRFLILNKLKTLSIYFLSSLILFIFLDFYVFKIFGHGFPSSVSEEKFERSPSPYDMFSGKAYYNDHNSDGFRGEEFKNSKSDVFQIAFFGGSTGYNGDPPIDKLIENISAGKFGNISREQGLLLVGAAENTIRLLPPLNTSMEEIDQAFEILSEVIREIKKN